jgi:hypothetical protein
VAKKRDEWLEEGRVTKKRDEGLGEEPNHTTARMPCPL